MELVNFVCHSNGVDSVNDTKVATVLIVPMALAPMSIVSTMVMQWRSGNGVDRVNGVKVEHVLIVPIVVKWQLCWQCRWW